MVEKEVENVENNVESWSTENCLLDYDVEDQYSYVYDFITEDSFISVLSYDQNHDLFYVIRVIGSKVAIDNITDDFKHVVLTNERYIEGRYLEVVEEKKRFVKYRELKGVVFIRAQEVHKTYVDINPVTLIMTKQEHDSLMGNILIIMGSLYSKT